MLSIQGGTYAEVFASLATDERLDDRERKAATDIAGWFTERDRIAGEEREARNAPDYDPIADHARRAPFFGSTFPEAQTGSDFRTFVHGDVRFTVKPYTTGDTMNVGIDRIDRSRPA